VACAGLKAMVAVQDIEYQTLGTLSCSMCFVWRSVMGRSRPNLATVF